MHPPPSLLSCRGCVWNSVCISVLHQAVERANWLRCSEECIQVRTYTCIESAPIMCFMMKLAFYCLCLYSVRSNYSRTKLSRSRSWSHRRILFGRCCVTVKMDVERTRTMPHSSLLPLQRLWVQVRSMLRCLSVDHSVILVWSVHRFARLAMVAQIIHRYHQCLAPQQLPPITRFYYTGSLGSQNLTDQNI